MTLPTPMQDTSELPLSLPNTRKRSRRWRRRQRQFADLPVNYVPLDSDTSSSGSSDDEFDRRRYVWEPVVHHSPASIKDAPIAEEDAMNCLLDQGCECPPLHYLPEHDCNIPSRRLKCLREIRRWKEHRHVVETMATKLPKELVLHTLDYVVLQSQPHTHLEHKRSLAMTARSIIGDSPVIDMLQPLAEEAILNTSIISLDTEFHGDREGKIAVLSSFVPLLPQPIRHFQMTLRIALFVQHGRQQYPGAFYSATAGMASLLSQLPRLRTLHLILTIALTQHPRDPHRVGATTSILDIACRKGFSGTSTFRQVIMDLLDAARAKESGPAVSLELNYEHPDKWRAPWRSPPETYVVQAGHRPALDVLQEADAKYK